MSKIAITWSELTPVAPFSQAIKVDGFIYFSGHIGQDPATTCAIAPSADSPVHPFGHS